MVRGRGEVAILSWVLIFPLGYYYVAYPTEQAWITLDRIFIGILLATVCFADASRAYPISRSLRKSALYWALFLVVAAVAIVPAKSPLNSLRLWTEAFFFPALLAWYVLRYFDVRRHLPTLHTVTCLMAIYVAGIGAAEVVQQRDLLPLPESGVYLAGDTGDSSASDIILLRPNGPFSSNNSYALIGVVTFLFLLFLRNAWGTQMPTWRRILHRLGVAAAFAEAVLPLFKSVLVSFAVVLLVDAYYQHGRRRAVRWMAVLGLGFALLVVRLALPAVFEERSDTGTFYARIAQEHQTLALFLDHPVNGVGLNNFHDASQNSRYSTYYKNAEALDYPHNNLGAILAETGLTGFLPFVVAQVFFVSAFWKLRRAGSHDSMLVWKSFLFIFLCYWMNGLSLTAAYYGDLNLWYMFVLAVLFKFAISSDGLQRPLAAAR